MLLRFGVKNHTSLLDYQELSCMATAGYDDLKHGFIVPTLPAKSGSVLPVIALYGANAAGKSNLLDAIAFFAMAVRRSYSSWEEAGTVPHTPFKSEADESESLYDCDVVIDNIRYHYGFSINSKQVLAEWLYWYPKGVRNILFQRDFRRNAEDAPNIYLGPSLKKLNAVWRALSEKSSILMLSAAVKSEHYHEQLSKIFAYFKESFIAVRIGSEHEEHLAEQIKDEAVRKRLIEVLRLADFGIVDVEVTSVPIEPDALKLVKGLMNLLSEMHPRDEGKEVKTPTERQVIHFLHQGKSGEEFRISYSSESSGTRYLLNLLVPVISAIENGRTLIVDEITTNLHTKLSEKILDLFTDPDKNKKHAQFIFSTHDTNLLSRQLLRRDEIWFAEKNDEGATSIYPLSDFKIRKNDNVEKGYLQGRFGAIPFVGEVGILFS